MKTRTKVLLAIGAGIVYFALQQIDWGRPQSTQAVIAVADLETFYKDANAAYFYDSLPKNTRINLNNVNPNAMASTTKYTDGSFVIEFNKKNVPVQRSAYLTMLHEMCHIPTFDEKDPHGPQWRACMIGLDAQGAFRHQIIDGYEGQ